MNSASATARRRLWGFLGLLTLMVAMAAAWKWSPLRDWLEVEALVGRLRQLGGGAGPWVAILGFALAAVFAVPLSLMIVVSVVAFDVQAGFVYCLSGACLGGAVSYGLGRCLGRDAVERFAGPRLNNISRRLAGHGVIAVVAIRLVPVAPFAIVNMLAGASHIRFGDFLLGTALGMVPGYLAIAFFIDQILKAVYQPGPTTLLLVAVTLALIAVGGWALRRWVDRDDVGPR